MLGGRKTIVLVEGHEAQCYATKRHLETAGFAVVIAATGNEAVIAAKRHPDLIVLDVDLPDMSGFDVYRLVKRDPATKHIPIVFMSASRTDASAVEIGTAAGAHSYLFNPATREQLLAVIAGALVKGKARSTANGK